MIIHNFRPTHPEGAPVLHGGEDQLKEDPMLTTVPTVPSPATVLPYEVLAVEPVHTPACWRSVGRYPDLDQAVPARIEDVLAQLVTNGWLVTAEHLVIGPGADGPATVYCCMTELGADPASDLPSPGPFELDATAAGYSQRTASPDRAGRVDRHPSAGSGGHDNMYEPLPLRR